MILGYPCILEEIGAILATPVPGLVDKVDSTTPPAFLFATCDEFEHCLMSVQSE